MKTKILNIIGVMMFMLSFVACSEDHTSDLQLSGDCRVEAFALDGYEGTIDFATRSIVVRLPEVYETSAMKVTSLSISDGAQCNISLGQTLNMDAAKVMHVSNGDVFLDWTISVLRDEARIYQFVVNDIYRGNIDQDAKTITIYVPASVDITALVPTIEYSANATITPASGVSQDFSQPVTYKVTNNSAESTYTVTVIAIDKPKALFIGAASTMDDLDPEANEACLWMMSNVEGALYASFAELKAGTVDLDECKIMWWHYHKDGGVDGHDQFVANAPEAIEAVNAIRSFYENGGSLLLTRYATNLPTTNGLHLTTVGVRMKTKRNFVAARGILRFMEDKTIIHSTLELLPVTILMLFTALILVTTSPTLLHNITLVPIGVTIPTMLHGRIAPRLPSSVWVVTVLS